MPTEHASVRVVHKPWGVSDLKPWSSIDGTDDAVGELWFDRVDKSAPSPALLLKLLFTSEPLSIQVHPDDTFARAMGMPNGKSEAWYVISAEPGARVGVDLGHRGVGEGLHLPRPQRLQARVGPPVLHNGPQDGCVLAPQLGPGGNAGAQGGRRVGRTPGAGQPGRGGVVAAGDGAPDEFGQDVVLAVEVEVETAAGDPGRGEDVADGEVAELPVGEQPGGGGQDGLPQVRGVAAGGPAPVRLVPVRLAAGGLAAGGLALGRAG